MQRDHETQSFPSFQAARPRLLPGLLERPALIARLNEGAQRRMTLVSAPAGSGKTTLLAQWVDKWDRRSAWFSVEAGRADLASVVAGLVAALRPIHPEVGATTARVLQSAKEHSPARLAEVLCRELDAIPDPTGLIVDNYELVGDPLVHEFFAAIIRGLPPMFHLVIATRIDPPLPLARLRAAGQLSELRAADLLFTHDESASFLSNVSPRRLPAEVVEQLVTRTEGWPVGLRLAALSLGGSSQAAANLPSGRTRLVMDYFVEEVLAQAGPDIIGPLLRSSILEFLSAPLVAAVSAIAPAAANRFLDYLERNNLFAFALDGRPGWFRLHQMLRETLLDRLEASESPERIAELHRRAADWHIAHGTIDRAIHHLLAAGDVDPACDLTETTLLKALAEENLANMEWLLAQLPAASIRSRPLLLVIEARVRGGRTGWNGVIPRLEAAQRLLGRDTRALHREQADLARGLIDLFYAPIFYFSGDFARALGHAERAQKDLLGRSAYGVAWAGFFAGVSLAALGRPDEGRWRLGKAVEESHAAGEPASASFALMGLCVTHLLAARLAEGEQAAAEMLAIETASGRDFGIAWASYLLGALAYETNRLEEAVQHFDRVLGLRQGVIASLALRDSMLGAALARQALGQSSAAAGILDDAERYILDTENVGFLSDLHSTRARVALMQGDLVGARMWMDVTPARLAPGPMIFLEVPPLTQARLILAERRPGAEAAALAVLADVETRCIQVHNLRHRIAVMALQASAMATSGHRAAAREKLEEALHLGRPGGFIRCFVEAGPPVVSLLRDLTPSASQAKYVDRLVAASAGPAQVVEGEVDRNAPEALTPRELQLLPLLQRRYTDAEIAHELGIAVSTVKRHTGNLYGKLQASGRRDAVRRATALGLLSPFPD